ncbi:hypothetical protein M409DRAFT_51188 [Zasmidium cellare ATCC 36951]|uniref:Uncharacterized protein n=1 Tax=Zasmidium cellare ATCC 36951 TaxID=1080233 RepID=A0A6A6CZY8_ZASCE|nr:uncharacterized protein M409DRAFT_51188 [Zasmidium cellare ATCC 36951]KAF2170946.1 hypothetical protein M409DRAFT_51188 [Zasmidium cellare ATCC 36951]
MAQTTAASAGSGAELADADAQRHTTLTISAPPQTPTAQAPSIPARRPQATSLGARRGSCREQGLSQVPTRSWSSLLYRRQTTCFLPTQQAALTQPRSRTLPPSAFDTTSEPSAVACLENAPSTSSSTPCNAASLNMAPNRPRCQRCVNMKKLCEGGHPCARCSKANTDCIPHTTDVSRSAAAKPPRRQIARKAPVQPSPVEEDSDQDDQDASDDDQPTPAPPGLPRLTSLRTKASGPDTWPDLMWSYVGNGQYCRKDGRDRVMMMRRGAAAKRSNLVAPTAAVESSSSAGGLGDNDTAFQGVIPAAFGAPLGPSANSASASEVPEELNELGWNWALWNTPIDNTSTRPMQSDSVPQPSNTEAQTEDRPAHGDLSTAAILNPTTAEDISLAQQQHEDFYTQITGMEPSTLSENRQGTMTGLNQDSRPRLASSGPQLTSSRSSTQAVELEHPFGNIRNTHATEMEYANVPTQPLSQRMETPPLPGQRAGIESGSTRMQPLGEASTVHATEALATASQAHLINTQPPLSLAGSNATGSALLAPASSAPGTQNAPSWSMAKRIGVTAEAKWGFTVMENGAEGRGNMKGLKLGLAFCILLKTCFCF